MLVPFAEDYVSWLDGKPSRLATAHNTLVGIGLCAAYSIWLEKAIEAEESVVMRSTSVLFYIIYGNEHWPFASPREHGRYFDTKDAHLNPVRQQFVRRLAQLTEACMDDYGNIVFKSAYVLSADFLSGFELYGEKLLRRSNA